jgi:hypothetical protein
MNTEELTYLYPIATVFGLYGLKVLSCRSALQRQRSFALSAIVKYEWVSPDGRIIFSDKKLTIKPGAEEITYGFLRLEYYSRRFLIQYGELCFLAIVSKNEDKPYVKLLDANRAKLVSKFAEWSTSVA